MTRHLRRQRRWIIGGVLLVLAAVTFLITSSVLGPRDGLFVRMEIGSRSLSKLPYFIALDQGLYEKHGLDLKIYAANPEYSGGKILWEKYMIWLLDRVAIKKWQPEIMVRGGNSYIARAGGKPEPITEVILASNDCTVRARVVSAKEIENLQELAGKRIGISSVKGNMGFASLLLAEKMGWDPDNDVILVPDANNLSALVDGQVDAIVVSERMAFESKRAGYPIVANLSDWNAPAIIGNSIRVRRDWLEDSRHMDIAERFLRATIEGIALMHQDTNLAISVIEEWYGITDPAHASAVYEDAQWTPRKPYPCYEGIRRAMHYYDNPDLRGRKPEDFYDDSLVRRLDESGFIDELYIQE